jgi:transketolase C-terminal domain/subunit
MGIPDCFPDKYGRQGDLINYFGLEEPKIYSEVQQMLATSEAVDSGKI